MIRLIIPESYTNRDWPRKVKQVVEGQEKRLVALETLSFATVTFTPTTEPASPVEGMTYYDSGTQKLRTYDGTVWQDHW